MIRNTIFGFAALILFAAATPPFGEWKRLSDAPILSPQGDGFDSKGVFNPAVVKKDGQFVMLYRAQDQQGTSRIGYAISKDGIHFTRRQNRSFHPKPSTKRMAALKTRGWCRSAARTI